MSLATRCPACNTTFKVVRDQLRISDGWVRCGRCSRVFDANDHMVDPSHPVTAVEMPGAGRPSEEPAIIEDAHDIAAEVPRPESMHASPEDEGPLDDDPPRIAPSAAGASWEQLPSLDLGVKSADRVDPFWSSADLDAARPEPFGSEVIGRPVPSTTLEKDVALRDLDDDSSEKTAPFIVRTPSESIAPTAGRDRLDARADTADFSFLGDVDPELERRRGMWRRVALIALALVALLVLVSQVLARTHDMLVAQQPALRPAMLAWCRFTGCTVSPLRNVDDIAIDGSTFVRQTGEDGYLLSFTLRNRSAMPLAMPAVELSLLDTQERPVLRRVLRPADFGAPLVLSARGEHSAVLPLAISPSQAEALQPLIAGYHLDAFYP